MGRMAKWSDCLPWLIEYIILCTRGSFIGRREARKPVDHLARRPTVAGTAGGSVAVCAHAVRIRQELSLTVLRQLVDGRTGEVPDEPNHEIRHGEFGQACLALLTRPGGSSDGQGFPKGICLAQDFL